MCKGWLARMISESDLSSRNHISASCPFYVRLRVTERHSLYNMIIGVLYHIIHLQVCLGLTVRQNLNTIKSLYIIRFKCIVLCNDACLPGVDRHAGRGAEERGEGVGARALVEVHHLARAACHAQRMSRKYVVITYSGISLAAGLSFARIPIRRSRQPPACYIILYYIDI